MKHIMLVGNTAWSMYNFRAGLIRGLLAMGYNVTVVAPADGHFEKLIEELGATWIDIQMEAKGTNPFKDLQLISRFKKIFKSVNPDFIFFYTIKPNIYGSLAARIVGADHIAVTTGLGYTFINNNFIAKIARMLYKFALKSAREVWFLNRDDQDSFLYYNLIHENKSYILKGEGINLDRFLPTANQNETVSFLLMARMLWDKGVGVYVEAARILKAKYPDTQFKLLGFMGVDNPSAISQEQMDLWQNEGVVEYLGSTNDVIPFVNNASCIVLPSYYREGLPITLLEAAAMCKPLVTTDSVGCRDTVDDSITGFLCKPKDVVSLCDAMEKIIIMTPMQRQAMGEAGRKKIEQEFNEELIINTYSQTLKKYKI